MVEDYFMRDPKDGTVGLSCRSCWNAVNAQGWPNVERDIFCAFHGMSLAFCLDENGNFRYEWFCKDINDNGSSNPDAIRYMLIKENAIKHGIMYRAAGERFLVEMPIEDVIKKYGMGKMNAKTIKARLRRGLDRNGLDGGPNMSKESVLWYLNLPHVKFDPDSPDLVKVMKEMENEGEITFVGREDVYLVVNWVKKYYDEKGLKY